MATVSISCLLYCCTLIMAPTDVWTKQDQEALETARSHCRTATSKDNECLIKFKKVEDGVYTAICGQDNNI